MKTVVDVNREELKNREGVEFKVWTPNNVYKDLKSGMKLHGSAVSTSSY